MMNVDLSGNFSYRGKCVDEFLEVTQIYSEPDRYIVPEVSDEEYERFTESILNAEVRYPEDVMLLEIFHDELTPYLAGQDTAANTANRINSRVGIYLAERYS